MIYADFVCHMYVNFAAIRFNIWIDLSFLAYLCGSSSRLDEVRSA